MVIVSISSGEISANSHDAPQLATDSHRHALRPLVPSNQRYEETLFVCFYFSRLYSSFPNQSCGLTSCA